MPELPEVETVCRMLSNSVVNKKIIDLVVFRRDLRWPVQADFEANCIDCEITDVYRRGKYIIISLSRGNIVWHLGMSGALKLQAKFNVQKHDHVCVSLSSGEYLVFNDPRRFGSVSWSLALDGHPRLVNLGLEPLLDSTQADLLFNAFKNKKKKIKDAIMDASIIVGVGNIYANEALFLSGIDPRSPAGNLTLLQVGALLANIKVVLRKAIDAGGTTLNDYVNLEGKPGYFQQELLVYGRSGEECSVCGEILQKLDDFSRQTVICGVCQS